MVAADFLHQAWLATESVLSGVLMPRAHEASVVITGASSGIGRATTLAMVRPGRWRP
jgi:hypothetical protein